MMAYPTYPIHKAQPIGDRPVSSATIVIEEEITTDRTICGADAVFVEDAEYLEMALYNALPGGTYDWLLVKTLERKASHLIVSHGTPEAEVSNGGDRFFDYRYLQRCDFPTPDKGSPSGESECRDPAVATGWWKEDMSDKWYLCQEHLDLIRKREDAEIAKQAQPEAVGDG